MKLYMHPVSTASRPVRLLIAENVIKCDEEIIDLFKGAHCEAPYASLNQNRMVPMLKDGDFRQTESSAILKYLADKYDLPAYPKDLKKRAKVNEVMDWLNTQFYRDFFRTTSAAARKRTAVRSPGDNKAQRTGCRFSMTTGSDRKTNISVATN
jgi:glutathione S-transferase